MKKTVITLACLCCIVSSYCNTPQWTESDIFFQLDQSEDSYRKGELYYQLSKLKISSEIDSAFYYARKSEGAAKLIQNKRLLAKSYFLLGYLYEVSDDIPRALEYYVGAKRVYEDIDDVSRVEDLDENLLKLAQSNNADEAAIFFAENRLKYLDDLPNFRRRADVYSDLGIAYLQGEKLIKANDYLWKALLEYKEFATIRDTVGYSEILLSLGIVQRKFLSKQITEDWNFYDSAKYFYEKAIEMNFSTLNQAWYENNMGDLYLAKQNYNISKNHLFKALKIQRLSKYNRLMPTTFNNLGRVLFETIQLDSAHYYFKQSVMSNIKSLTPLENIRDKANNVNFYNHDELKKSLAYLDSIYWLNPSLKPLDEIVTAEYFKDYVANQDAIKQLKETYILNIALKENRLVTARMEADARRDKIMVWVGAMALCILTGLIFWYILRVRRLKSSMTEFFECLDEYESDREYFS